MEACSKDPKGTLTNIAKSAKKTFDDLTGKNGNKAMGKALGNVAISTASSATTGGVGAAVGGAVKGANIVVLYKN